MARVGIAGEKVAGVGEHEMTRRRIDVGALRVHDLRADGKRRRFAALRQPDRLVGVEQPGMEQIDFARIPFERVFVGQARSIVFRGEACDVVSRLDRLAYRAFREIRRRCVTAALAEVHGDAQPLVTRVLDRLDLALAHGDRQPGRFADLARRVRCAERSSHVRVRLARDRAVGRRKSRKQSCDEKTSKKKVSELRSDRSAANGSVS